MPAQGDLPLCFILMPFGRKTSPEGLTIDFDRVHQALIAPAVREAGLDPVRADQETTGGIIHKAMYERLILCPFAVADLTLANANVFYELGVRHAFRPSTTVQLYAEGGRLPFDVQMLRTIPYVLQADGTLDPARIPETRSAIAAFLKEAREGAVDSPIYQLIDGLPITPLDHLKTDVFTARVQYAEGLKQRLEAAKRKGKAGREDLLTIENELGDLSVQETGILVDLMLAYRAVSAFQEMANLINALPRPVRQTVLVREQLGFALNRLGRRDEAEQVLGELIRERGTSSETCGLLGRVYKDKWEQAMREQRAIEAEGYLERAVEAYLQGFEHDWRDFYPGINAVTLMELRDPPDERRHQILPVVRYAVERKIAKGPADYWDLATQLELAVLASDQAAASKALARALARMTEKWMGETTARNLRLIRESRERRGPVPPWMMEIEKLLAERAAG